MKLREYFESEFAPVFLADSAPRTFEAYEGSLAAWERHTDDPELPRIDVRVLAAFKAARAAVAAPATVNKDLRHLGHLLAKAGPPGHRNRDALGLLPSAPWTKPLRVEHDLPKRVTLEQIARVYQAAEIARVPRLVGVSPAAWWQALFVLLYNVSARIGAALALEWPDVDWTAGEIRFRARGDKRRRTRVKPMNDTVKRHLLRIRGRHDRVFPLTCGKRWFYRQLGAINAEAGLAGGARVLLHDLKRASLTEASGIPGIDPFAVALQGDHASLATTTKHYINPSGRLATIAAQLPQPAAFANEFDERQGRLFA